MERRKVKGHSARREDSHVMVPLRTQRKKQ